MGYNRNNQNWQDKFLGGTILGGFIAIAVTATLFALANWGQDRATAKLTRIDPTQTSSQPFVPYSANQ